MIPFLRNKIALLFFAAVSLCGHDIPNDLTVQTFVKPDGRKVQVLVRLPLTALRDIDWPRTANGSLDMEKLRPLLNDAAQVWLLSFVDLYVDDAALPKPKIAASQLSLPSDASFQNFETALKHVGEAPLPNDANVQPEQIFYDALLEYPVAQENPRLSIYPNFAHLAARVLTIVRYMPSPGVVRPYELAGDPGIVQLDPRWYQAALRFVHLGFEHILDGTDHLLFLGCLVLPYRKFRPLLVIVTAFTVAHSITLIASAFDLAPGALWFPPMIETLIALSILYMALENVAGMSNLHRRWILTFGFGLVHGFGFSFALRDSLQFAGSHLLTSLLAFNVGVELGQLLVLTIALPALMLLFRYVLAERVGVIIFSALIAHIAWHWMEERYATLSKFAVPWQTIFYVVGCVAGAIILLTIALRPKREKASESDGPPAAGQADLMSEDA